MGLRIKLIIEELESLRLITPTQGELFKLKKKNIKSNNNSRFEKPSDCRINKFINKAFI